MNRQQFVIRTINAAREMYTTTLTLRASHENTNINNKRLKEDLAVIDKVTAQYASKIADCLAALENNEIEVLKSERSTRPMPFRTPKNTSLEDGKYLVGNKDMVKNPPIEYPYVDPDIEAPIRNIAS